MKKSKQVKRPEIKILLGMPKLGLTKTQLASLRRAFKHATVHTLRAAGIEDARVGPKTYVW